MVTSLTSLSEISFRLDSKFYCSFFGVINTANHSISGLKSLPVTHISILRVSRPERRSAGQQIMVMTQSIGISSRLPAESSSVPDGKSVWACERDSRRGREGGSLRETMQTFLQHVWKQVAKNKLLEFVLLHFHLKLKQRSFGSFKERQCFPHIHAGEFLFVYTWCVVEVLAAAARTVNICLLHCKVKITYWRKEKNKELVYHFLALFRVWNDGNEGEVRWNA